MSYSFGNIGHSTNSDAKPQAVPEANLPLESTESKESELKEDAMLLEPTSSVSWIVKTERYKICFLDFG